MMKRQRVTRAYSDSSQHAELRGNVTHEKAPLTRNLAGELDVLTSKGYTGARSISTRIRIGHIAPATSSWRGSALYRTYIDAQGLDRRIRGSGASL